MSAQIVNFFADIKNFLPWASFIAGLGGSLHCVGMCGGLVTASCSNNTDIIRYQIGRLIGYLILGSIASAIGSLFNLKNLPLTISLIPPFIIGALFIYWGYQNFRGKKAEFPTPKFLSKIYQKSWSLLVARNKNFSKSFFIGFLSLLLPCGFLYAVILGTVSLTHSYQMILVMFFFWLGTLPSMVAAPSIVRTFLKPMRAKLPKTYAVSLMMVGVLTISFRAVKMYDLNKKAPNNGASIEKSCH